MADNQIGRLLLDLWSDLRAPGILWQVGVLAGCVLAAWWIGRLAQWRAPEDSVTALKRGAAALRRVAFPLLAQEKVSALAAWHERQNALWPGEQPLAFAE